MTSPIRELLNAAQWRDQNLDRLSLVVTHRGAPGDVRTVACAAIQQIGGDGVEVRSDHGDEPTWLPYHRVLRIERADGALVWSREAGLQAGLPDEVVGAPSERGATSSSGWSTVDSNLEVLLPGNPLLTLDGSAGEGGGQMLRSSLSLSLLTGQPFALKNIRAGRSKPGLMRQHLTCVNAAAQIGGAKVSGGALGSTELVFEPGAVRPGDYCFDIGSAGSVGLVLQTVALPLALAKAPSRVEIRGGTHVQWAPPVPFLQEAWWPQMVAMGLVGTLRSAKSGFYPAGGGQVELEVEPASALRSLRIDAAAPRALRAHAVVANLPESIARRELTALAEQIQAPVELHASTTASPGPGNACWLVAEGAGVSNVFSAFGERGRSAEDVALAVAEQFLQWQASDTSVCEYLSDQLMLPLALAGGGHYTSGELSLHARTNRAVIRAFLDTSIAFETDGARHRVRFGD